MPEISQETKNVLIQLIKDIYDQLPLDKRLASVYSQIDIKTTPPLITQFDTKDETVHFTQRLYNLVCLVSHYLCSTIEKSKTLPGAVTELAFHGLALNGLFPMMNRKVAPCGEILLCSEKGLPIQTKRGEKVLYIIKKLVNATPHYTAYFNNETIEVSSPSVITELNKVVFPDNSESPVSVPINGKLNFFLIASICGGYLAETTKFSELNAKKNKSQQDLDDIKTTKSNIFKEGKRLYDGMQKDITTYIEDNRNVLLDIVQSQIAPLFEHYLTNAESYFVTYEKMLLTNECHRNIVEICLKATSALVSAFQKSDLGIEVTTSGLQIYDTIDSAVKLYEKAVALKNQVVGFVSNLFGGEAAAEEVVETYSVWWSISSERPDKKKLDKKYNAIFNRPAKPVVTIENKIAQETAPVETNLAFSVKSSKQAAAKENTENKVVKKVVLFEAKPAVTIENKAAQETAPVDETTDLPRLIRYENEVWIYGVDSEGNTKLTRLDKGTTIYQELQFGECQQIVLSNQQTDRFVNHLCIIKDEINISIFFGDVTKKFACSSSEGKALLNLEYFPKNEQGKVVITQADKRFPQLLSLCGYPVEGKFPEEHYYLLTTHQYKDIASKNGHCRNGMKKHWLKTHVLFDEIKYYVDYVTEIVQETVIEKIKKQPFALNSIENYIHVGGKARNAINKYMRDKMTQEDLEFLYKLDDVFGVEEMEEVNAIQDEKANATQDKKPLTAQAIDQEILRVKGECERILRDSQNALEATKAENIDFLKDGVVPNETALRNALANSQKKKEICEEFLQDIDKVGSDLSKIKEQIKQLPPILFFNEEICFESISPVNSLDKKPYRHIESAKFLMATKLIQDEWYKEYPYFEFYTKKSSLNREIKKIQSLQNLSKIYTESFITKADEVDQHLNALAESYVHAPFNQLLQLLSELEEVEKIIEGALTHVSREHKIKNNTTSWSTNKLIVDSDDEKMIEACTKEAGQKVQELKQTIEAKKKAALNNSLNAWLEKQESTVKVLKEVWDKSLEFYLKGNANIDCATLDETALKELEDICQFTDANIKEFDKLGGNSFSISTWFGDEACNDAVVKRQVKKFEESTQPQLNKFKDIKIEIYKQKSLILKGIAERRNALIAEGDKAVELFEKSIKNTKTELLQKKDLLTQLQQAKSEQDKAVQGVQDKLRVNQEAIDKLAVSKTEEIQKVRKSVLQLISGIESSKQAFKSTVTIAEDQIVPQLRKKVEERVLAKNKEMEGVDTEIKNMDEVVNKLVKDQKETEDKLKKLAETVTQIEADSRAIEALKKAINMAFQKNEDKLFENVLSDLNTNKAFFERILKDDETGHYKTIQDAIKQNKDNSYLWSEGSNYRTINGKKDCDRCIKILDTVIKNASDLKDKKSTSPQKINANSEKKSRESIISRTKSLRIEPVAKKNLISKDIQATEDAITILNAHDRILNQFNEDLKTPNAEKINLQTALSKEEEKQTAVQGSINETEKSIVELQKSLELSHALLRQSTLRQKLLTHMCSLKTYTKTINDIAIPSLDASENGSVDSSLDASNNDIAVPSLDVLNIDIVNPSLNASDDDSEIQSLDASKNINTSFTCTWEAKFASYEENLISAKAALAVQKQNMDKVRVAQLNPETMKPIHYVGSGKESFDKNHKLLNEIPAFNTTLNMAYKNKASEIEEAEFIYAEQKKNFDSYIGTLQTLNEFNERLVSLAQSESQCDSDTENSISGSESVSEQAVLDPSSLKQIRDFESFKIAQPASFAEHEFNDNLDKEIRLIREPLNAFDPSFSNELSGWQQEISKFESFKIAQPSSDLARAFNTAIDQETQSIQSTFDAVNKPYQEKKLIWETEQARKQKVIDELTAARNEKERIKSELEEKQRSEELEKRRIKRAEYDAYLITPKGSLENKINLITLPETLPGNVADLTNVTDKLNAFKDLLKEGLDDPLHHAALTQAAAATEALIAGAIKPFATDEGDSKTKILVAEEAMHKFYTTLIDLPLNQKLKKAGLALLGAVFGIVVGFLFGFAIGDMIGGGMSSLIPAFIHLFTASSFEGFIAAISGAGVLATIGAGAGAAAVGYVGYNAVLSYFGFFKSEPIKIQGQALLDEVGEVVDGMRKEEKITVQ